MRRASSTRLALVTALVALAACKSSAPTGSTLAAATPVARTSAALTAVGRTGWTASACSTCGGTPANAVDASTTTSWITGSAQTAGQFLLVDMKAAVPFESISMDTGSGVGNYPRGFTVGVSNDGTSFTNVASGTGASAVVTVGTGPQTARYIKVTLTQTAAMAWNVADFNVYNNVLPRTGWALSASPAGTGLANAIDGTATTKWSSGANQASGQFFQVDMLDLKSINQITLDAGTSTGEYPHALQVLVSKDGGASTFTNVAATATGTTQLVTLTFPSVEARYLRISLTGAASNLWSIYELNVFGSSTPPAALPRTGLASAPGTHSSPAPGNGSTIANALDGATASRWTTGAGQAIGNFFELDMLTPQSFTQLTLDASNGTDYPRGYQVFVSNDGTTWGSAIASGTGAAQLVTAAFPLQNARYVKVQLTQAFAANWWSIAELNVYGPAFARTGWAATSSTALSGTSYASNAIDGSATTRWSTGVNQASGQTFQLDMGVPETFSQLTVDAGTSTGQYPRGYQVFVSSDGATWGSAIATGTGTTELLAVTFPIQTARFLKIVQTGTAATPWAIQELNVLRACGAATCVASDQCHNVGVCDPVLIVCSNPAKANGTTCNDAKSCTANDVCTAGVCGGTVTCPATDQCHTAGVCDGTGACTNPTKANGTTCDDTKSCTTNDVCTAGVCGGTVSCPATNQCHTPGACDGAGACTNPTKPNGTTCDDANLCTAADTCQAGTCSGTPVTCSGADTCHTVGVCVPATGCPAPVAKAPGTSCNDANACTTGETCQAGGACANGTPVTCAGADQCNTVAACVPATGCPAPAHKADGTSCSDGSACTLNDTCQAGACVGGTAATCAAPDQCHLAGTCDSTSFPTPPQGGLVGWWKFDGDTHDSSGHGLDLNNNGAQLTGGKSGQAYSFDGTTCLSLPTGTGPLTLAGGTGVTMMAWVRTGTAFTCPGGPRHIMAKGYDYEVGSLCDNTIPNPDLAGWVHPVGDPTGGLPGGIGQLQRDTWRLITITWDGQSVAHYIDGQPVGAYPVPGQLKDVYKDFTIGCLDVSGGALSENYIGSIDEATLYNRPLTSTEINGYYVASTSPCTYPAKTNGTSCSDGSACTLNDTCQAGTCAGGSGVTCAAPDQCHTGGTCNAAALPAPPSSGLVGLWHLDGDTTDASGNGLTLTNQGATLTGGISGQAYDFDGTSCLTIAQGTTPLTMNGATGVTMMAWVRTSSAYVCPTTTPRVIMGKGYDYSLASQCSDPTLPDLSGTAHAAGNPSIGFPGGVGGLTRGGWTMVAVTWDGHNLVHYVNGQRAIVYPDEGQIDHLFHTFAIGCAVLDYPSPALGGYVGSIDEVSLYSRPLGDAEIGAYYTATTNPCTYVAKADGTTCNDANACTQTDTCQAGTCTGSNPVTCTASDQCHTAGACDASTGTCSSSPKADGTSCDDGNACSSGDACVAGMCSASSFDETCTGPSGYLQPQFFQPKAGYLNSDVFQINNGGTVVGYSSATYGAPYPSGQAAEPFVVARGAYPTQLPNPWPNGGEAYAFSINEQGYAAGYGGPDNFVYNTTYHNPVLYHPDHTFELLPQLPLYSSFGVTNTYGPTTGLPDLVGGTEAYDPGVMGAWRFDGDAQDLAGHTPFPAPAAAAFVAGRYGQAVNFDGSTCLQAAATLDTAVGGATGVTMMAWVKPDPAICAGAAKIVVQRGSDFVLALTCNTAGHAAVTHFLVGNETAYGPPVGDLPFGQWSHVTVSWDHQHIRTYINGAVAANQVLVGTQTGNGATTVSIGCSPPASSANFVGGLDDVTLFRNPMGADQVSVYMNNRGDYRAAPSLLVGAHWQFSRYIDGFYDVLPVPAGAQYLGWAYGIGRGPQGLLFGSVPLASGSWAGVISDPDGKIRNANELLPIASDWDIQAVSGINAAGIAIGSGLHNGNHAIFKMDLASHEIVDLGPYPRAPYNAPAYNIHVNAINATGHIVGTVFDGTDTATLRPVVYVDGVLSDLNDFIDPASGWTLINAVSINDSDEIVGFAYHGTDPGRRGYRLKLPATEQVACAGKAEGDACDDHDACTHGETCHAGSCTPTTTTTCAAASPCHPAGTCDPGTGVCTNPVIADGTGCSDGNACKTGGTCQGGACLGGMNVDCSLRPVGPCQVADNTCDPVTGCHAPVPLADGTSCNDGNACTQTDKCQAGACVGADPVTCPGPDECHVLASMCDPTTGMCSSPPVTGTSTACAGGTFDYDKAGRLVRDHNTTLVYDAYDQLRAVVPGPAGGVPLVNLPVEDLSNVGDDSSSYAEATNDSGQVIVDAAIGGGVNHVFLSNGPGAFIDVSAVGGIPDSSYASSISSSGAVLGNHYLATDAYEPFRFRAPNVVDHPAPFPGNQGYAYSINSSGQFVGYLGTFLGARTAFRYTDGVGYEDLGGFGGVETDAWHIDDDGTVYLSADLPNTPRDVLSDTIHFGHAAVFDPTTHVLLDLNTLVDQVTSPGWTLYTADGFGAGFYYGNGDLDGVRQPYRLNKATGEVLAVGVVGTGFTLIDHGNRFGDLVGWGYKTPGFTDITAWVYVEGRGFLDLNDLIDPASGWHIDAAYVINDEGDVVGEGKHNGKTGAFRIRLPLRTAGAAGPALAEAHTYGYDGLRTSTSTGNDPMHMQSQYWFSQDYTETTAGNREHYVRMGSRIVAKITMKPGAAGGFVPTTVSRRDSEKDTGGGWPRLGLAALLLALGFAGAYLSLFAKRRGWVPATAAILALIVTATSCEMFGVRDKIATAIWHSDTSGADAPHYFHSGIAPGPTVVTDSVGVVFEERRYEPFGQPIDSKGSGSAGSANLASEPQNILGKLTDPNTGWSYHGARWMAPQTARWSVPDLMIKGPHREHLLRFWDLNPYQYGAQNPTLFWDPTGLQEAEAPESEPLDPEMESPAEALNRGTDEMELVRQRQAESAERAARDADAEATRAKQEPPPDERVCDSRSAPPTTRLPADRPYRYNSPEFFSDAKGRKSIMDVTLKGELPKGSRPSPSITPPGFIPRSDVSRGHMLANQLGGSGSNPDNLFTIQQNPTNGRDMRMIENRVKSAVDNGETVYYKVSLSYIGESQTPAGITIEAKGDRGLDIGISLLNPPGMK